MQKEQTLAERKRKAMEAEDKRKEAQKLRDRIDSGMSEMDVEWR